MKLQKTLQSFLVAALLATGCYTPAAHAVDTDIFVRDPDDSGVPNIIVMFGNDSSSWESAFVGGRSRANLVHEAMHRILDAIGTPPPAGTGFDLPSEVDGADNSGATFLNLGFAMYSDGTSPPGAKIYAHIKNLTEEQRVRLMNQLYYDTSENQFLTLAMIDALDQDADDLAASNTIPAGTTVDGTDISGRTYDEVLTDTDYQGIDDYIAVKKTPGNASPSRALAELLHYFRGDQPMSGTQDSGDSTYRDNEQNQLDEESLDFAEFSISGDPPDDNITDIRASETTIYDTLAFNNDFLANNGCADNHIIYFGFTRPQSSVKNNDVKPCFSSNGQGADLSQTCTDSRYTAQELLANDDGDTGPGEGWDFRAFNDGSFIEIPDRSDFPGDDYSGDEDFMTDEWSQYLFAGIDLDPVNTFGDQIIRTHWINVTDDPDQNSNTRGDQAFFQSVASNGGGEYEVASTADEIVTVFTRILSGILAENAVFASTALPVSVNVRGTNLNQIYLGVFRADGENRARWWGNLKQYKLGLTDNGASIELQDADGNASQGADGFINSDARSLWTFTSSQRRADGTGYWGYDPRGDIADDDLKDEDNPDGEVVEKGAIAQSMREAIDDSGGNGSDDRNIYTYICSGASCQTPASVVDLSDSMDTTTKFVTGNGGITADNTGLDALNVGDWSTARKDTITNDGDATRALGLTNLIQFYRGDDADTPYDLSDLTSVESYGDEDEDGSKTDARPGVHGDVLHSRPSIINYNRLGDDSDVVVFYGSNDGMIHAIQGGEEDHPKDGDDSDTGDDPNEAGSKLIAAGNEIWSFVAEEHFGKMAQQFVNDMVDNGASPRTTEDREIFFDGTFTSIVRDNFNEVAYLKARDDGDPDTDPLTDARALVPAFDFGDATLIIRDAVAPFADRAATDADEVLLFTAARRGGDILYAFDVSNPYEPAIKWRRRGPDAVDGAVDGATTTVDPDGMVAGDEYLDADDGYYELGQTWSAPTPITLNIGGTLTDVLIFGKGYDPSNDDFQPASTQIRRPNAPGPSDPVNDGLPKMGAGVMIVNADTGTPIWQVGSWTSSNYPGSGIYVTEDEMIWSIPSDVTAVDRERNGIFEKFYVGDTGGNVWRGDISDSNPSNWTITKLADLGDHRDNEGSCNVSGNIVTASADCTAVICDISGAEFDEDTLALSQAAADNDTTGCPTFICNDGSISAGDYGDSCGGVTGGTCDGGSQVAAAQDCPYTCPDSGAIRQPDAMGNYQGDCPGYYCPESGEFILAPDNMPDLADCPGVCNPPQTLNNQGECTGGGPKTSPRQEVGAFTQEAVTAGDQQGFTPSGGAGGIFAQESFSQEDATVDTTTTVNDRRFIFAPDVVPNSDPDYDAILIGSGDRELPDSEYVEDRFYMLKDTWVEGSDDEKAVTGGATSDGVISPSDQSNDPSAFADLFPILGTPKDSAVSPGLDAGKDLFNATNNTIQGGTDGDGGTKEVARDGLADARGWFINLIGPNSATDTDNDSQSRLGEKVVSSAVTLGGVVFFNTNEPTVGDVGACDTTLGTARSYAINYDDATVPGTGGTTGDLTDRFQVLAAGGFPPSPVPFVIDFDGEIRSGVQIGPVPIEAETETYNKRQRVFWFQDIDLQ